MTKHILILGLVFFSFDSFSYQDCRLVLENYEKNKVIENYREAISSIKEPGDSNTEYFLLGLAYRFGVDRGRNLEKATHYFELMNDDDIPELLLSNKYYYLGEQLYSCSNTPKVGLEILKKSSEHGHAMAEFLYAYIAFNTQDSEMSKEQYMGMLAGSAKEYNALALFELLYMGAVDQVGSNRLKTLSSFIESSGFLTSCDFYQFVVDGVSGLSEGVEIKKGLIKERWPDYFNECKKNK